MTGLLLENIKPIVLFVLIASVIVMSHFGAVAPESAPQTRQGCAGSPLREADNVAHLT